MIYLWVGFAGGVGACLRLLVGRVAVSQSLINWPVATLFVNVSGSFMIGFLFTMFQHRWLVAEELKVAIIVGFLGGFTTFSAFSLETVQMLSRGQFLKPAAYAASTLCFCLLACWLGMAIAKSILR